ncbi:hypothetical protein Taro_033796 [Colocasia esculenta]|uniref:Uncharacterized protein n=1 Tax=Colocasia esculenta TaxID=4460 RepID=A0A843W803_COLES|nr:hypothetical protein [Colocasia esculenta]
MGLGRQITIGSYEDRDGSIRSAPECDAVPCRDQIVTGTSVVMALRKRPIGPSHSQVLSLSSSGKRTKPQITGQLSIF